MRPATVASFLLALCAHAYRDSDNVGQLTSAEDLHRHGDPAEGPHATTKPDKKDDDEKTSDCRSQLAAEKYWTIEFKELEEEIVKFVRNPIVKTPDDQDTFGGLVAFDGGSATNVAVRLGARVAFTGKAECNPGEEDLRFSSSPKCDSPGVHVKTNEEDSTDNHKQFLMMTASPGVVVLKSEQMGDDENASLEGDWTYENGDFQIKKEDDKLVLQQKPWSQALLFSGEVAAGDAKDFHHIELSVADKECAKFKEKDCPNGANCQWGDGKCQATKDLSHNYLRIKAVPPNELRRDFSSDNTTWMEKVAHRSFTPADAELSGFICVQTANETWIPLRGITFKQISGDGPSKDLAKSAAPTDLSKEVFGKLDHGRVWLQVSHKTYRMATKDQWLPPWRNAMQGTVEWKKAGICPENYPLCMNDGSCALQECQTGCEWSRAPQPWSDPAGGYNYVAGYDSEGTECDLNNAEASEKKSSASTLSCLSALAAMLLHFVCL